MNRPFSKTSNKIHKPISICLATLIGGPLTAGYLIAANFRSKRKFLKSLVASALTIIATIISIIVIRNTLLYNPSKFNFYLATIVLTSALIAFVVAYYVQYTTIDSPNQNGDRFYPLDSTILFGVGGIVLDYFIIFSIIVSINVARYNQTAANMTQHGHDQVSSSFFH
jgi:hypothetical protein